MGDFDGLFPGSDKKNKEDKKESKKFYKNILVYKESIDRLYDICFTESIKNGKFDYTQADALKEGLELLANKIKAVEAPEGFKNRHNRR